MAKRLGWLGALGFVLWVGCGSDADDSDDGGAARDGGMDATVGSDGGDDSDATTGRDGGVRDAQVSDGQVAGDGQIILDGTICPPCVPPPSPDCVGTGICGCGPYRCPDAGPMCGGTVSGTCDRGLDCSCCPAGGPLNNCLCSTPCKTDDDCDDAARPVCQRPPDLAGGGDGFCAPADFRCCWLCR